MSQQLTPDLQQIVDLLANSENRGMILRILKESEGAAKTGPAPIRRDVWDVKTREKRSLRQVDAREHLASGAAVEFEHQLPKLEGSPEKVETPSAEPEAEMPEVLSEETLRGFSTKDLREFWKRVNDGDDPDKRMGPQRLIREILESRLDSE